MRATSLLLELPGRALARAVLAPAFLAVAVGSAHAGGLGDHEAASDPCPPGFVIRNDGSMTDEMLRQWRAVREMSCPHQVEVPLHRVTGLPITDEEKLRWAFNGLTIPRAAPSVIPLPGAAWALIAGLGALVALRRRRA